MLYNNNFSTELEIRKGYIAKETKKIKAMNPMQDSKEIYACLENIAGQIEKLSYYLRKNLVEYHLQLQFKGLYPNYDYLNNPPDVAISEENGILILTFDGLLPTEPKGGAFYLNGKMEDAILGYRQKLGLSTPMFPEKCGLIFYHHYNIKQVGSRHLRDFDNLEKRTVTNVLARHFMSDDNPLSMISTDILVPDTDTYTQVEICSILDFKRLISEANI